MNIIGINGSPRKGWNTHLLVEEALKGAAAKGAETELINLYDLDFRGCISCFQCKVKGGKSPGRCAVKDDLKGVLDKIHNSDGFVIGSPIYISEITAAARALLERLVFQYISYNAGQKPLFDRRIRTGLIITTNAPEQAFEQIGYTARFKGYEGMLGMIFGPAKVLYSAETLQVTDYGKYEMSQFNEAERKKRREEVFPRHLEAARTLGEELTQPV
ncbi:MAG: flavodoxin family protein [Spirochaetaceae bacterium]|nr:flavodoxin family protein [Spirochaetaceae bacterium]